MNKFRGIFVNIEPNTVIRAFILNSLLWSSVTTFCVAINEITRKMSPDYNEEYDLNKNSWQGLSVTFVSTFFATMFVYGMLHVIFGFGNSMVTDYGR